jgi:hypothetical protein
VLREVSQDELVPELLKEIDSWEQAYKNRS